MRKKGKILVVDDNAGIRSALKILLPMHFEAVELLPSPVTLVSTIETFKPDAILLDMNFKTDINTGNEGLYWLGEIKSRYPQLNVILFTAYADISLAVEGMKRGAFNFLVKPWENEKLVSVLSAAVAASGTSAKKAEVVLANRVEMFWGNSDAMGQIRHTVQKIAPTDATILITGENGTGKDVLTNEIHRLSSRCSKPFVSVDAGAIPETLFESELFGHIKGAFTDAVSDKPGKFQLANGGTLFLDEIGNISLAMQAKLLRVLQNRTITRVGDTKQIPIDIRLICATNMDLAKMVAQGEFREDLYYRINTMHFHIPALRQRIIDIVPLATIFMEKYSKQYRRSLTGFSSDARAALSDYPWNGNVRELQNCIEKAVILSEGNVLTANDLSLQHSAQIHRNLSASDEVSTLEEAEQKVIRAAMEKYSGNLSLVAKALDISRPTLYSKLKKYGL